jgi:ATP-dependent DNA ligase
MKTGGDERGHEGLVAKDEASAYESGRTMRWLKVKQKGWTVEEDRWQRTISVASARLWQFTLP